MSSINGNPSFGQRYPVQRFKTPCSLYRPYHQPFPSSLSLRIPQEALKVALEATASVSGEDLLSRFTKALTHQPRPQWQRRAITVSITSDDGTISALPTLRKLHNFAVWIRQSTIHSDQWDDQAGLRLDIDNATRWSSWYALMDKALRKKTKIIEFMTDHEESLGGCRLTVVDWGFLEKAHQFLQPFTGATLYSEGNKSSIPQSLVLLDALLVHDERKREFYSKPESYDQRMIGAIGMGWFIIDKYYQMTKEAPVHAAVLLLDPSRRVAYIKHNWSERWHGTSIESAHQIWLDDYVSTGLPADDGISN